MRRKCHNTSKISLLFLLVLAACTPSTPDYQCLREGNSTYDRFQLNTNVAITSAPMGLEEILEIALCRNLDVQLQEIEQSVYNESYVAEKLRQVPSLTMNGEFSHRDNTPAWYSKPLGGEVGALPSVSQEQDTKSFDITAAWNLVDFGLTYVKTRQEKSRACLKRQQNLRARQNLILDVHRAYYRAVVANQAREQAKVLIDVLEKRRLDLKRQMELQLVSEMRGLLNDNRLIDLKVRLHAFDNEYHSAMAELSALMGLPPGSCFQIADINLADLRKPEFDVCKLEDTALISRPELIAQDIQYEIDADEVKASIIRMFPNAKLFGAWYYDDDQFQYHNNWVVVGAQMAWDLLALPAKWSDMRMEVYRRDVAVMTRLSMSMGVLTQVHLANINVNETFLQFELSEELREVKNRQLEVAKLFEIRGEYDADDIIVYQVEALFAEVNMVKSYASYHVALEQLGNSIGKPLVFQVTEAQRPRVDRSMIEQEPQLETEEWDVEEFDLKTPVKMPEGSQELEELPRPIQTDDILPIYDVEPPKERIEGRRDVRAEELTPDVQHLLKTQSQIEKEPDEKEEPTPRAKEILEEIEKEFDEIFKSSDQDKSDHSPWQYDFDDIEPEQSEERS